MRGWHNATGRRFDLPLVPMVYRLTHELATCLHPGRADGFPQRLRVPPSLWSADAGRIFDVSSSIGSDKSSGRAPHPPVRSFRPLTNLSYQPGDSILLRCGDTVAHDGPAVMFLSTHSQIRAVVLSEDVLLPTPAIHGIPKRARRS
jgi:hypothetical protein